LSFAVSGLQFDDTSASVLTGSLARAVGESVADGPYAITQGALTANANYTIDFLAGMLIITATPAPLLFPLAVTDGESVTISWSAVRDVRYRVQFKSEWTEASWTDMGSEVTATESTASTAVHPAEAAQRFYRVIIP
jgi:hypothetical protein